MTEEIIKDCVFCENGRTCNIYPWTCDYDGYCSSNEECPIKEMIVKLKRLEQENFALTQESQQKSQTICELEQENNAYKQSEQEAIEIIKELKEYSQRMENQRENYYKEYKKYRSALEEIREIADKCKECLNEDDDCGCDYLRIKRRIDEVLGND